MIKGDTGSLDYSSYIDFNYTLQQLKVFGVQGRV